MPSSFLWLKLLINTRLTGNGSIEGISSHTLPSFYTFSHFTRCPIPQDYIDAGDFIHTIEKNIDIIFPMPTSTEALKEDLDQLTPDQLQQVIDFIAFLKFRDQPRRRLILDPAQLATQFMEFANEDYALAEAGISDYAAGLDQEDQL